MSIHTNSTRGAIRSRSLLGATFLAAITLVAAACVPPAPPTTWTPGVCPTDAGVTVVVDFDPMSDEAVVRCALGAQDSGLDALENAGFTVTSEPGPGTVCTIDALPAEGYPYCWLTGGYWSYWKAGAQGDAWSASGTGPGAGPLTEGSVEGWRFAPGFVGSAPRVSSDGTP